MAGSSRSSLPRLLPPLQIIVTAALAVWVLGLLRPIGVEGQWQWQVFDHPIPPLGLVAVLAAILLTLLLAHALSERAAEAEAGSRAARTLGAGWRVVLVLGAFSWTIGLYNLVPGAWYHLTAASLSDVSNEYFVDAYRISDPVRYCREYGSHQAESGHHIATHPPGAVLTYYGTVEFYRSTGLSRQAQGMAEWLHGEEAGAVMDTVDRIPTARRIPSDQVALPALVALTFGLLGVLCTLPAAACGRLLWGERAAFPAAALAATVPGLALFFQSLDAPVALVAMVAIWAAARSVVGPRPWLGALGTGVILGVGIFITFGLLAAAAVCGIIFLGGCHAGGCESARSRYGWLLRPAAMVAGILAVWAPACALLGLDPVAMMARGAESHAGVIETFDRAYGTWVWMNLVEYTAFLGPALLLLTLGALPLVRRTGGLAGLFTLAVLGTLVLVDVSGSVRAEVGRIWVFFMPPMAVIAAGLCTPATDRPEDSKAPGALLGWTLLCQVAALVVLAISVHPSVRAF
jgi:hypothetical protein